MLTGREGTLREREIKLESDNKLKEKKEESRQWINQFSKSKTDKKLG